MGLFSKKNGYEAAAMELEEQQRRRERSQSGSHAQAHTPKPAPSKQPPAPTPAAMTETPKPMTAPNPLLTYGIDEVIQLMRDLPDNKKEMVIHIVQKTLLSAKIDIKSILEKAARKIDNLQTKNDKLRAEIRDLEEMIIQKKSDVDRLRRDMEETQQVRQSFESVFLRGSRAAVTASIPPTLGHEEDTFPHGRAAEPVENVSG